MPVFQLQGNWMATPLAATHTVGQTTSVALPAAAIDSTVTSCACAPARAQAAPTLICGLPIRAANARPAAAPPAMPFHVSLLPARHALVNAWPREGLPRACTSTRLTSQALDKAVGGGEGQAHQAEGEAVLRHELACSGTARVTFLHAQGQGL